MNSYLDVDCGGFRILFSCENRDTPESQISTKITQICLPFYQLRFSFLSIAIEVAAAIISNEVNFVNEGEGKGIFRIFSFDNRMLQGTAFH